MVMATPANEITWNAIFEKAVGESTRNGRGERMLEMQEMWIIYK